MTAMLISPVQCVLGTSRFAEREMQTHTPSVTYNLGITEVPCPMVNACLLPGNNAVLCYLRASHSPVIGVRGNARSVGRLESPCDGLGSDDTMRAPPKCVLIIAIVPAKTQSIFASYSCFTSRADSPKHTQKQRADGGPHQRRGA